MNVARKHLLTNWNDFIWTNAKSRREHAVMVIEVERVNERWIVQQWQHSITKLHKLTQIVVGITWYYSNGHDTIRYYTSTVYTITIASDKKYDDEAKEKRQTGFFFSSLSSVLHSVRNGVVVVVVSSQSTISKVESKKYIAIVVLVPASTMFLWWCARAADDDKVAYKVLTESDK